MMLTADNYELKNVVNSKKQGGTKDGDLYGVVVFRSAVCADGAGRGRMCAGGQAAGKAGMEVHSGQVLPGAAVLK